jgi:hypothetical protein
VNDELVVMPLLTNQHGLKEQVAGKRNGHVINNRIIFNVALSISCQAHTYTTQTQIDL